MVKRLWVSLTQVCRVHKPLQPLGPVAVLLPLGGALLVHVGCDIWSQELCLQLTQRDVHQRSFGACAIGQTACVFTSRFLPQSLRIRNQLETDRQPGAHSGGPRYLVEGVGRVTVQLLIHCIQPV